MNNPLLVVIVESDFPSIPKKQINNNTMIINLACFVCWKNIRAFLNTYIQNVI